MKFAPDIKLLVFFTVFSISLIGLDLYFNPTEMLFYLSILVFIFVAAWDAIFSMSLHKDIKIIFPDVVRMSKNNEIELGFSITTGQSTLKQMTIGISFPSDRFVSSYQQQIHLQKKSTRVAWPMTGLVLGCYHLDTCHIETPSRFGLWAVRSAVAIECELRVYPNMFQEKKTLSAIFLDTGIGVHTQRRMGKGKEFEQLREYLPGDPYEDIHWKATAKRGQPGEQDVRVKLAML